MSIEMKMLLYSTILLMALLIFHILAEIVQNGIGYFFSARDDEPEVSGYAGRFERVFYNMLETFPAFGALVLMVEVNESWTSLTAMGAHLYFWSRVFYVPVYIAGVPFVRTLVWLISFIAMCLIGLELTALATGI